MISRVLRKFFITYFVDNQIFILRFTEVLSLSFFAFIVVFPAIIAGFFCTQSLKFLPILLPLPSYGNSPQLYSSR